MTRPLHDEGGSAAQPAAEASPPRVAGAVLRSVAPRWETWAALGVLLAGIALRVAVAFPSHKYAGDADAVLAALRAFDVMRGKLPVFLSEVRLGSLCSWITAALFELFGVSRASLALEPVLVNSLQLVLWYLLWRESLGPRLALAALPFAAVPPPEFTYWTYMPLSYSETVLLSTATLWFAVRLERRGGRVDAAGFGLSAGLGFWNSFETLGCTLPALLWLAWRTPREARGALGRTAAGAFTLGALPWIIFNIHHPLGSFHGNFAARPAAGAQAALENAGHLLTYTLPELIASAPVGGPNPAGPVRRWLMLPVLAITLGAALYYFLAYLPIAWRGRRRPGGAGEDPRADVAPLFLMVACTVCGLYVASEAGSVRGFVVRYVLPLEIIVPGLLAVALCRLATRARAATVATLSAIALGAAVIVFDLCGTYLPWSPARQRWAHVARADVALVRFLTQHDVRAVVGPYWTVYPVNFISRERILGLPLEPPTDIFHLSDRLPATPVRWALLDISRPRLLACQTRIPGRLVSLPLGYHLLLPAESPAPASFLARLRAVCQP